MKVLVTGATGRIGANVIDRLMAKGHDIIALVFPGDPNAAKMERLGVEIAWADLRDEDGVEAAVARADAVMNFAAVMVPSPGMSLATYEDINVNGPYKLGMAIKAHADRIQRVLHVSSDAIYTCFNWLYLPIDEDHPKRPFYPYARVKWLAEELMWSFCRETQTPLTVIRPGAVAGAGEYAMVGTAGELVARLKSNNGVTNPGAYPGSMFHMPDHATPWDLVTAQVEDMGELVIPVDDRGDSWMLHTSDVRDVADGALLAFESDAAIGEAFNIVGPRGITWREQVEYLAARTGRSYRVVTLPCPAWRYELDFSKAKRMLGYDPKNGMKEKVDDSLRYLAGDSVDIVPTDVTPDTPLWEAALKP